MVVYKICPVCGKEFKTSESFIKRGRGKHCSKKCADEALSKKVEVTCASCGKKFFKHFYKVKSNKSGIFYCKDCCKKKKLSLIRICSVCKKEFKARRSNQECCSYKCSREYIKICNKNKIIMRDNYAEIVIVSKKWGEKRAFISLEDVEKVKNYTWQVKYTKETDCFYVVSSQSNNRAEIKLHRYLLDCPKGMVVDHINHNPLDNRRENIRICSPLVNSNNVEWNKGNNTGYAGITKTKSGKYQVYHSKINLGKYVTLEEAIKVKSDYVFKITNGLVVYKNKGEI